MKTTILILTMTLFLTGVFFKPTSAQTPVTDVGAGIQREALWQTEKGILTEINLYNLLIKALNGDIKGLTGEILGIDKEMMESLKKVSTLIKDYKRIQETREILGKIIEVYTQKLPKLVQDKNFTLKQAAVIVESFDIVLDDSRQLVTTILETILKDDLFMMDDKQRYDTINEVYNSVRKHYGTISYLHNKLLYASYMKSYETGDLESFAMYYSLYK
jgi:DNA mismatch repair ATPase MutS